MKYIKIFLIISFIFFSLIIISILSNYVGFISAKITRQSKSGVLLEILHPVEPSSNHLNDASVVTKITFGEISFVFTGDAEHASEEQILKGGFNLKCNILKVGHHGSRTSTSSVYLESLSPETAIIMCGIGNSYNHPHEETLTKLENAGINVYRTDLHGTVIVVTDGLTYEVKYKKNR